MKPRIYRQPQRQLPNVLGYMLAINKPHSQADVDEFTVATKVALVRLLDGTAEPGHLGRLDWDINLAGIRAERIGNNAEQLAIITAAGEAIDRADAYYMATGAYTVPALDGLTLQAGIDLYETILLASTPKEMSDAETELQRRKRSAEAACAK